MKYSYSLRIPQAKETFRSFFSNFDTWFRLNPQWEVLSLEPCGQMGKDCTFTLEVKYDDTEENMCYQGMVEEFLDGTLIAIRLDARIVRLITIKIEDIDNKESMLLYEESRDGEPSFHEKAEINLWVRSVANYITVAQKRTFCSRIWKRIIDGFWLKMGPSGRRVVFFIIVFEGAALILFLFFLIIWFSIFKRV